MDSNQVIADATVALAVVGGLAFIANVLIASFTLKAARATRRSAEATETAAKATRDEADATREEAQASRATIEEIQKDREIRQRPFLRWDVGGGAWVEGTNRGAGPALNALFCVVHPDHWVTSARIDVSPAEKLAHQNQAGATYVTFPNHHADQPPGNDITGGAGLVAFCEDSSGNRYRFRDKHVTTDVWRPTEQQKPAWVVWYEQQVGY